ncbi:Radical SAM superfamily protein [Thermanaeromonas toyohensis ToBE]|uniref:Radical SAM superfamily protein n=1 Tax=Thermanaeromonas toyohensis ToBE TaxID=698762 RepID=A0A1W1VRC9_9FIRM|nr:radical SAM protein [Thermanaeromonas toyohensis]SMB95651.1 Radical SAM superfamily protein [Thermanaeromonas toyohensis ToBE]
MVLRLIRQQRKTPVLKAPSFGCLKGIPVINVTRGCPHSCVYCYARGFPEAPLRGEIHLYVNLPELLEKELGRRKRLPRWVSFSTASDPFPPIDEVLKVSYQVMEFLLRRGIGISFLTKGVIPPDFVELFARHCELVRARVGLVSLNDEYQKLFEPFAAPPFLRLANIRNLTAAGVKVSVRMDPLIPGVADSEGEIESLVKRLKVLKVKELSISALILRPSVAMQLAEELPLSLSRSILKYYQGQPWQKVITSARTKLLPASARIVRYQMIKEISARYGLACHICGCKNPDLPWESCNTGVESANGDKVEQLTLF